MIIGEPSSMPLLATRAEPPPKQERGRRQRRLRVSPGRVKPGPGRQPKQGDQQQIST